MKRTLCLRCETLTELDDADLTGVVGGQYSGTGRPTCFDDCYYTVLNGCIDLDLTRYYC